MDISYRISHLRKVHTRWPGALSIIDLLHGNVQRAAIGYIAQHGLFDGGGYDRVKAGPTA